MNSNVIPSSCDAALSWRRLTAGLALVAALLAACFIPARAETLLLTGATVHTVSGATYAPGDVLIKDGKITGVFDAGRAQRPPDVAGTVKIDLRGQHLYPGLIALNSGLGLAEISAVRATLDSREVGEFTPEVQSWLAVNPDSELLPVARANGVAYFEPAPGGAAVSGQSGLVALDGWTYEQMTFRPAVALHVYWPEVDLDSTPKARAKDPKKWKSLEDQARERREKRQALEEFFEEARAYVLANAATGTTPRPKPVPAWEAMGPFVRGEKPITVHADDVRAIRAAVQWAEKNRYRITLAEARDAWMVAPLLAEKKIPVVFNHVFTLPPRDTDSYDVHFSAPAVLHRAGVPVAFSLGVERASLVKNLPYEAAQAVAHGLPADEALKGLTLYPAQIAGVAEQLGSIDVGKVATLFAADGDILDIRAQVKRLWIAGREIGLETRHTRFYEKYRHRPKP